MRSKIIVAGTLVALVAALGLLLLKRNATSASTQPAAAKVLDAQPLEFKSNQRPRLERPGLAKAASVSSEESNASARSIRVSSDVRRDLETDSAYERRLSWLSEFGIYVGRAELTDTQREQLLSAMADLQIQALASVQLLGDALHEIDDQELPSVVDMEESLSQDFLHQLTTFLNPKQVIDFRRVAVLGAMLGYGYWQPLEIGPMPVDNDLE